MKGCLIILVVAIWSLACGPETQQAPAFGDASDQPKSGGVLTDSRTSEVADRDPTMSQLGVITYVVPRIWDTILDVKTGPDVAFNEWVIIPRLAERWEVSSDSKQYTFHIRKGVKFANLPPVNGRELTAADVKWSLEYIARVGQFKDVVSQFTNQLVSKVGSLERVETPDPYTVVVYFKDSFAPFLSYAAMPNLAIMPHEVYDQDKRFSDRSIGSGPWMFDSSLSQTGTRMVYKKNPDYWQAGKPYVDELRTIIIPELSTAFAAFQTKQIDILNAVRLADAETVKNMAPNAPSFAALGNHGARFYYNVNVPPFTDVRFRRAMSLATDREEFVKAFTNGEGSWGIDGGIPGIFSDQEVNAMYRYDPEEAKRLLRESGYADKPIEIEYLYQTSSGAQGLNDIQLLQAQWKKVGIALKITPGDQTDIASRYRVGGCCFMMVGNSTGPGEPEPDFYFYGYFHSRSGTNYYHVNDPKLDQFAEAQRRESDPAKRRELWREQARYIHDNGLSLFVYFAPTYFFQQSYVKGYYPSLPTQLKPTADIWLDK